MPSSIRAVEANCGRRMLRKCYKYRRCESVFVTLLFRLLPSNALFLGKCTFRIATRNVLVRAVNVGGLAWCTHVVFAELKNFV